MSFALINMAKCFTSLYFAAFSQELRLKAGFALAIFAFNNTSQQYRIREAGGIQFRYFEDFLESNNEYNICYAAFQVKSVHTGQCLCVSVCACIQMYACVSNR